MVAIIPLDWINRLLCVCILSVLLHYPTGCDEILIFCALLWVYVLIQFNAIFAVWLCWIHR